MTVTVRLALEFVVPATAIPIAKMQYQFNLVEVKSNNTDEGHTGIL